MKVQAVILLLVVLTAAMTTVWGRSAQFKERYLTGPLKGDRDWNNAADGRALEQRYSKELWGEWMNW